MVKIYIEKSILFHSEICQILEVKWLQMQLQFEPFFCFFFFCVYIFKL